MVAVHVDITGIDAAIAAVDRLTTIESVVAPALLRGGQIIETQVKANASGRPGPNVITGQYRAEITTVQQGDSVHVGTNAPQAMRLENGFAGADSRGRVYNQPPFPHFEPAFTTAGEQAMQEVARAVTQALR